MPKSTPVLLWQPVSSMDPKGIPTSWYSSSEPVQWLSHGRLYDPMDCSLPGSSTHGISQSLCNLLPLCNQESLSKKYHITDGISLLRLYYKKQWLFFPSLCFSLSSSALGETSCHAMRTLRQLMERSMWCRTEASGQQPVRN